MSPVLQLIPAVDLMGGRVVRAAGGRRDDYRPLDCVLCSSADPFDVLDALRALHPFPRLYIADLDAIQGRGDQRSLVAELGRHWPGELWLDAGLLAPPSGVTAVVGSEVHRRMAGLRGQLTATPDSVLSMDFRGDCPLGPATLLHRPEEWPGRVILMNLARVGSGAGPDTGLLERLRARAPGKAYFLAGGVRDAADLRVAAEAGAAGILLASVLWDGRLSRDTLAACG